MDFTLHLANQADIQSLFRMTPYCWKTPKAGVERMEALENLDCQASFRIHIFKSCKNTVVSKPTVFCPSVRRLTGQPQPPAKS